MTGIKLNTDYWLILAPRTTRDDGLSRAIDRSDAKQVERFAYYFRREFGYDFVQFEASEDLSWTGTPLPNEGHPYLFTTEGRHVGAACFRWRTYTNIAPAWWLAWIWLHPYARRRGRLTKAWPTFIADHPGFFVEPPLSPAMQAFLATQGYAWYPPLPEPEQGRIG